MSDHLTRLIKHRVKRKKSDTAQLAAQLAPLEEQNKGTLRRSQTGQPTARSSAHQERGAIVVDNDSAGLGNDIVERKVKGFMGMEPVVLVILVVMLAFIAFVAWQISQMPPE